ncbi:MAG: hypothetical protein AAF840_18595, partial [Bacteroidota bacterium]
MRTLLFVFALCSFSFTTQAANTHDFEAPVAAFADQSEPLSIFIHITAAKVGANGVRSARIGNITLAEGKRGGKGKVRAKLKRVGNRLQFEIQWQKKKFDRLVMPEGFILNDRIATLLGSSGQVVMSGGSTM